MAIIISTSFGDIIIRTFDDKAPQTVNNFLAYCKSGFYEGTIFSRVMPGFMIQCGGYTEDLDLKPTRENIENEAHNGLKNSRGSVAMARTNDPHSANAQFFINCADNDFLNFTGESVTGWGYCVFAEVIQGMEVVDRIAEVQTQTKGNFQNVPVDAVTIEKVTVGEKS